MSQFSSPRPFHDSTNKVSKASKKKPMSKMLVHADPKIILVKIRKNSARSNDKKLEEEHKKQPVMKFCGLYDFKTQHLLLEMSLKVTGKAEIQFQQILCNGSSLPFKHFDESISLFLDHRHAFHRSFFMNIKHTFNDSRGVVHFDSKYQFEVRSKSLSHA